MQKELTRADLGITVLVSGSGVLMLVMYVLRLECDVLGQGTFIVVTDVNERISISLVGVSTLLNALGRLRAPSFHARNIQSEL